MQTEAGAIRIQPYNSCAYAVPRNTGERAKRGGKEKEQLTFRGINNNNDANQI